MAAVAASRGGLRVAPLTRSGGPVAFADVGQFHIAMIIVPLARGPNLDTVLITVQAVGLRVGPEREADRGSGHPSEFALGG